MSWLPAYVVIAIAARRPGRGADPNARMREGSTALTAAAYGGYADVVMQLLARHADPRAADQQGRTPLMAAALNGHIVELLRRVSADARRKASQSTASP